MDEKMVYLRFFPEHDRGFDNFSKSLVEMKKIANVESDSDGFGLAHLSCYTIEDIAKLPEVFGLANRCNLDPAVILDDGSVAMLSSKPAVFWRELAFNLIEFTMALPKADPVTKPFRDHSKQRKPYLS